MGFWIFGVLGTSLGLTILIELLFAIIIGIRNKKDLLLVGLVNILTNPPVVLAYYILIFYAGIGGIYIKVPLEITVILVEMYYYKSYGNTFKHPFWFSFFANAVSFGIGEIINIIF